MNKNIQYKTDLVPEVDDIIAVYDSSGINRPTTDQDRIAEMYTMAYYPKTGFEKVDNGFIIKRKR